MASADVRPGPEVLAIGPRPIRRPSWRPVVIVLVVALLVTVALVVWWIRSRPTDDFALADVQDIYSGMVRSDGTNDAAVAEPGPAPAGPGGRLARSCLPLVDTTLADQLPANALDGVSTYWLGEGSTTSAVSLFTLRYRDSATAVREYQAIADALTTCDGNQVTIGRMRVSSPPRRFPTRTAPVPSSATWSRWPPVIGTPSRCCSTRTRSPGSSGSSSATSRISPTSPSG